MKFQIFWILCLLSFANCSKFFSNGRLNGGNLPPPGGPLVKSAYVEELYFTQKLDHFTPTNTNTWQQRYFTNSEYYNESSKTVFLMIGGEGEASIRWMTNGSWINSAKEYGAFLFQLEHRFYGRSLPTANYSTENLRYLTSQQALADLANFITSMNEEYNFTSNVKWIAFGGSYPGSLAAWLRQQYPHLVAGAMSASGPLLAVLDFHDYYRVIVEDLEVLHSRECVDSVSNGIQQLEDALTNLTSVDLNSLFNLCDPIEENVNDPLEVSNLFLTIADTFAGVAQYNDDNRLSGVSALNVNAVCNILTNSSVGTELERLASFIKEVYGNECFDYSYSSLINYLQNDVSDTSGGYRQWWYQTCTEFGFYQTSTHSPHVFGDKFPIEFFIQMCEDLYGSKFNETFLNSAINRTNIIYGALDIEVSNVVFVHGTVDPWHPLGILETVDARAPAILINGTAHCANMYEPSDADLPQLVEAREEIHELIGTWLRQ